MTMVAKKSKPRKVKTAEDLKAAMAAAEGRLKKAKTAYHKTALDEAMKSSGFAELFKKLKASTKDVSDIDLLSALAASIGIKRLTITQAPPKPRSPKQKK